MTPWIRLLAHYIYLCLETGFFEAGNVSELSALESTTQKYRFLTAQFILVSIPSAVSGQQFNFQIPTLLSLENISIKYKIMQLIPRNRSIPAALQKNFFS